MKTTTASMEISLTVWIFHYTIFFTVFLLCVHVRHSTKLSLNGLRYSMQDKRHERSFPSRLIFDMHGLLVERIRLEGIYEYTLGGMDKN